MYFPLPPPLLLIKIQLWVKSLAGKSLYRPGSAVYKKVTKTGCVLFNWSELNGQGSFSFKTHFFSWFSNVFCFLNDSKKKMHFSQHFFLRMSRHFAGSKLLHIAASLYSEYVTAGLICFLSFQAYFPPVGGKTLGAFQSRIIKRTETPYIFMYFFFLFFCYLYFSSFVFPN